MNKPMHINIALVALAVLAAVGVAMSVVTMFALNSTEETVKSLETRLSSAEKHIEDQSEQLKAQVDQIEAIEAAQVANETLKNTADVLQSLPEMPKGAEIEGLNELLETAESLG